MSEEKKNWITEFFRSLEAKDYVRTLIISAAIIAIVLWNAFRDEGESRELMRREFDLKQDALRLYFQRREDSLLNACDAEKRAMRGQLDEFKDELIAKLEERQARSEVIEMQNKRLVKQNKRQIDETGSTTKQLDSASKTLSD